MIFRIISLTRKIGVLTPLFCTDRYDPLICSANVVGCRIDNYMHYSSFVPFVKNTSFRYMQILELMSIQTSSNNPSSLHILMQNQQPFRSPLSSDQHLSPFFSRYAGFSSSRSGGGTHSLGTAPSNGHLLLIDKYGTLVEL
jgi:hypothetical protein